MRYGASLIRSQRDGQARSGDEMRRIHIIGMGAGDPDYMTVQAIRALNDVDVFFIPDKGTEKAALRKLRTDICDRFIEAKTARFIDVPIPRRAPAEPSYHASVDAWHGQIEDSYRRLLTEQLPDGKCGGFLVWGDPTLYDSTLRILESLRAKGFDLDYDVIPGISSVQALAAKHRVPLNRIGEPVLITTGRKLAAGLPVDSGNVVVMLDGEQAFAHIDADGLEIFWGAYLGTPEELLLSGKLTDMADEIEATRERARAANGWIMDTYLLRRSDSE
jgi:precorrin-6A synthase